eukprot:2932176-Alexandrium_andersonii.AAC.1
MSASLVGSEMCIRDRVLRAVLRTIAMRAARSFILETGLTPNIKGPNIACLLYTSDAADDM